MRLHPTITDALRRVPRTRNAVIAGGVGASLALGSGVALAAGDDLFAADAPAKASHSTHQQAAAQSEAAEKQAGKAEKEKAEKADEAEKKADKADEVEKKADKADEAEKKKAEKKAEARKQAAAEKKAESRAGADKGKAKAEKKKASRSKSRAQAPSWTLPVSKPYTKTAGFADSGDRWSASHSGQDFAVPTGTSVKSVHGGTVVTAGWGGAYGNEIVVEHPNGKYSQYAHLSKIGVVPGEQVNTGEQIGVSGSTGNSSGPHLHFEIRTTPVYGSGFDPVPFLKNHGLKP